VHVYSGAVEATPTTPVPRRRRVRLGLAPAVALIVFAGSWLLIHHGFYNHNLIVDTPVYQGYGDAMAHGQLPYRDFALEYPPGSLPAFVLPALGQSSPRDVADYNDAFEIDMWLAGAVLILASAFLLRALGATQRRIWATTLALALMPLAIGSLIRTRFDLYPAALTVLFLLALVTRRNKTAAAILALATAVKLYPAVLLPLLLIDVWRRLGRRGALAALGVYAGTLALVFLPFVVLAPHGVIHSLDRQLGRPLQLESLGAVGLLLAHTLGQPLSIVSSYGSQNVAGGWARALGLLSTVFQVGLLARLWWLFAHEREERGAALLRYSAALVAVFIAFGKVLSPQFLIWLVPLVLLVPGRRGLTATAVMLLSLILTQLYFPGHYWDLVALKSYPIALVALRDLLLVTVAVVLVWRPRSDLVSDPIARSGD